jgi:hypothetical protein
VSTPGIGAYWFNPFFIAAFTNFTKSGLQLKSGNPWAKLMATCSFAWAVIIEKMVVPTPGSLLLIAPEKFIIGSLFLNQEYINYANSFEHNLKLFEHVAIKIIMFFR